MAPTSPDGVLLRNAVQSSDKSLKSPKDGASMKSVRLWVKLVCVLCAVSSAVVAAQDRPRDKLVITGSSTVAPLVSEIARAYEALHPGVRIDVQTGGSSRGIADVRAGLADIGMVSRALKPDEADLNGLAIARDGIAVILHADNPVKQLSDAQIAAIYTGTIRNWKDVGGNAAPITVIHKADGRSTLELFLAYFKLRPDQVRPSVVIGDNQQGIKTLAGNPDGIAYVSIGSAEVEAELGTPLKLLPLNGILPTTQTVKDGRFPLSRPLTLVTRGAPTELQKAFIAFARSKAAHALVREQAFVPLD